MRRRPPQRFSPTLPGVTSLLVSVLIAGVLVGACSGATYGAAAAPAPPRVTVITDSVGGVLFWATQPREDLGARLDLRLETKTCRKLVDAGCPAYGDNAPESALATVERLGPELGRVVVVDVGYNDQSETYASGLDAVMGALLAAGVQQVIWVTLEETEGVWKQINDVIRAAPARWPELTVADWAPVAAGKPWFVDDAHLNFQGAVGLAAFLRPLVLDACGPPCAVPPPSFCGLSRTVNGFDDVAASLLTCRDALMEIVHVERGDRGAWNCSRAVGGTVELDCRRGEARLQILERSPVAATRAAGVVTLANWAFRLRGTRLEGRSGIGPWHLLVRTAPYCEPAVPREVLVALRLRALTPHGGCFAAP